MSDSNPASDPISQNSTSQPPSDSAEPVKLKFASRKEQNAYYKAIARGEIDDPNDVVEEGKPITSILQDGTIMTFESKDAKRAFFKAQNGYKEPYCTFRDLTREVWACSQEEPNCTKEDKMELLRSIVYQMVGPAENPFSVILELHRSAADHGKGASGISGLVLDYFAEWLAKRGDKEDMLEKYVDLELKKLAFRLGTEKSTACLLMLSDLFILRDDDAISAYAVEQIQVLIDKHNYKEAMEVVEFYEWANKYDIHAFVIPCYLQNRDDQVHRYLTGKRKLQEEFLDWLDSMLLFEGVRNEKEILDRLRPYKEKKIMTIDYNRFYVSSLKNIITKQLKKYNLTPIAPRLTPNWCHVRKEGGIRYTTRRRYEKGDKYPCDQQTFVDIVYPILRDNPVLQKSFLINLLQTYKVHEDAVWWAEYLNMDNYDKPRDVKEFEKKHPNTFKRIRQNVKETRENAFLNCGVKEFELEPEYMAKMVDTVKQMEELTEHLLNEELIGIDSEWKPSELKTTEEVALLQVATSEAVYLVDFCTLEDIMPQQKWFAFFEALFCTSSIKLGFDFANDVRSLSATIPGLEGILKDKMKGIVDLKRLADVMLDHDDSLIDLSDPSKAATSHSLSDGELQVERSFKLSVLYKQTIGGELDKSCQLSNWSHRPLRNSQMRYAAWDAYCLILIFSELKSRASEKEYDFDLFISQSDPSIVKEKKKKEKKDKEEDMEAMLRLIKKMNTSTLDNVSEWKSARDLKIIVDAMLCGLGKHLRRLGVDVLMPNGKDEVKRMGILYPDRVILSSGKSFTMLAAMYSFKGRVLCIPQAHHVDPADQAALVFREFKVKPDVHDVFTRCMLCNAAAFVLVPGPIMEFLFKYHIELNSIYAVERTFNLNEWIARLSSLKAEDHRGVGCTVELFEDNNMIAKCERGWIDLGDNLVYSECLDAPVEVLVKNVPGNVFARPGWFYYVCGQCGKVYWDGGHQRHYVKKAQRIIETSESSEPINQEVTVESSA